MQYQPYEKAWRDKVPCYRFPLIKEEGELSMYDEKTVEGEKKEGLGTETPHTTANMKRRGMTGKKKNEKSQPLPPT